MRKWTRDVEDTLGMGYKGQGNWQLVESIWTAAKCAGSAKASVKGRRRITEGGQRDNPYLYKKIPGSRS